MSSGGIGFKKMNWMPKRSAWQEMQLAQQRRYAAAERIDRMNMAAGGFHRANEIQIQGVGDLAAQGAQARLEAKVKEMQAELEKKYESFSKLV